MIARPNPYSAATITGELGGSASSSEKTSPWALFDTDKLQEEGIITSSSSLSVSNKAQGLVLIQINYRKKG